MESPGRECRYRLDARDRVAWVSPEWLAFARENHAEGLAAPAVVGRPVWDFIRGMETQAVYRALFRAVRTRGAAVTFPFRCDSPSTRRYMELRVSPGHAGHIELAGRLLRSEARLYLAILDCQLPRHRPRVELCSFCKRIHVAGCGWFEADEALGRIEPFASDELPELEHGICDACASDCAVQLDRAATEPGPP